MLWLPHKTYTSEYLSEQLSEFVMRVRCGTRRMVYVASIAVGVMAFAQMSYIYGL